MYELLSKSVFSNYDIVGCNHTPIIMLDAFEVEVTFS